MFIVVLHCVSDIKVSHFTGTCTYIHRVDQWALSSERHGLRQFKQ